MSERILVTFPVTISLDVDVAQDRQWLRQLRDDIAGHVETACLDEASGDAIYRLTPNDDDAEPFALTVGPPTVDLCDYDFVLDRVSYDSRATPIRG